MNRFRWNAWNSDHATRHGVSPQEAEAVVEAARSPFPQQIGDDKQLVIGRGRGARWVQVIYVLDDDGTVYILHARPLTAREKTRAETKEMKKFPSPYKTFAVLSDAEKEAVYTALDDPTVATRAKPLGAKQKKLWAKSKRKAGRPRVGRGAKRVLVSIEQGLLEQADTFARRQRMTRSELFSRGVKAVLAMAG